MRSRSFLSFSAGAIVLVIATVAACGDSTVRMTSTDDLKFRR